MIIQFYHKNSPGSHLNYISLFQSFAKKERSGNPERSGFYFQVQTSKFELALTLLLQKT